MTGILNILAGALGVAKDTYFNLVSLLLPGNGTNGAQNNTFLDSSTNNFTITRNGNTTQGTFSPFSQTGWGNYFDGSVDSLSVASNAAFAYGTSDFTWEVWVFPTASTWTSGSGNFYIIEHGSNGGTLFYYQNRIAYYNPTTGTGSALYTGGGTVTPNQWSHIAVSRQSGTTRIYVNGQLSTSGSDSNNYAAQAVSIGISGGSAQEYVGYMSNVRIVKGTAVYTSNFTPPTSPLTAISGTSLLTCQSNRFIDNSSNNFTITVNGNTSVVAFSPFAPTAAYTTAAVGGSGYFDGTGDYLTAPGNSAFDLGSGDFTIEAWIYTQGSGSRRFIDYANGTASNSNFSFFMSATSGNVAYGGVVIGSTVYSVTGTTTVTNTWTHVALVRNGTASGNLKLYVNGVAEGTAASLGSTAINTLTGTPYLSISSYYNGGGELFNGYVSSARIIKGTALYTGNFTPSTAPFTAVSGTSLLLNFTNAGITDATAKNDLETVGNAQISTSVSKFGGGSLYIPNTASTGANKMTAPNAGGIFAFGTGDFTIEAWFYLITLPSGLTSPNNEAIFACGNNGPLLAVSGNAPNANKVVFAAYGGTLTIYSTNTVSAGVWYHVAVSRASGTTRMYINGVLEGTSTTVEALNASSAITIGQDPVGNNQAFNGYIDDLRITRGYARYVTGTGSNANQMVFNGTNNLALPTAPFAVQ